MPETTPDLLIPLAIFVLIAASLLGGLFRTVAFGFLAYRMTRLLLPALGIGAIISYFW